MGVETTLCQVSLERKEEQLELEAAGAGRGVFMGFISAWQGGSNYGK